MNESSLGQYLSLAYAEARAQQPGVGRRQLKQQIINHFWRLPGVEKTETVQKASALSAPIVPSPFETDPDPHDIPGLTDSGAIGTRGIVVRTHFDPVDQAAWDAFLLSLEDLERRSLSGINSTQDSESEGDDDDDEHEKEPGTTGQGGAQDTEMAEADHPSATTLTYETDAIFVIIDPTRQELGRASQESLSNASNIMLLRLFSDALVVPAPPLPADSPKRVKPAHRLVDEDGFQEVYTGPIIWVWDQQSAKDQTLRLVSSRVFVYGDATADSWRVKAAHMWDLQVDMDAGMRIDFSGGTGVGWSVDERTRNMKDALI